MKPHKAIAFFTVALLWAVVSPAVAQEALTAETQEEVDAAYEELQAAISGLRVSKTNLEYFLNKAKEHVANGDTEDLVESVQKLFEEAIAEGEAAMADESATKEEVFNAAFKLMKAIQALGFKAGDKTDLEMALDLTQMIDLDQYVEEGRAEYLSAKENAEAVMADGDAMQEEVNSAWQSLTEAMSGLRLKADKAALEELLDSVAGLDLSQYTEESVQSFKAVLQKANAVLADESLSVEDQDEVEAVIKELSEAKEQLVLSGEDAEDSGEGENPDGSEETADETDGTAAANGNESKDSSGSAAVDPGDKAAKTGDTVNPFLWTAVLGMSAFAVGAVSVKRRKRGK